MRGGGDKLPIRVLHVVGNMNAGGLETLIMNWYRHIDRSKIQFDFLVHYREEAFYEKEIISLGGKVYHTSILNDKNFISYRKYLKEFFSDHREYKIIHGHHAALGSLYLNAAKDIGIPTRISHAHNASYSKTIRGIMTHIASRKYSKFANVLFACSDKAGNYMYPTERIYNVINNGIDINKFSFSPKKRRKIRDIFDLDNEILLIHVGRFHDQKNHTFLIDIFSEICKIRDNAKLMLVGSGPLKEHIETKTEKLKLKDKCLFLGNRDDVDELLCAADVFIFPSLYEGLPLTLVEAQSSGLPIICSDAITKETKLTEAYFELSLRESARVWAELVISKIGLETDRKNAYIKVKRAGYDCRDVANMLQNFYVYRSNIILK